MRNYQKIAFRVLHICVFLSIWGVHGCKTAKQTETGEAPDLVEIAKKQIGDNVLCTKNSDGTYSLCIHKSKDLDNSRLKYLVISKEGELVIEPTTLNGKVKWGENILALSMK